MTSETGLARLCELAGLVPSFRDAWGNLRHLPEATQRALLGAMGISAGTDAEVAAAIRTIQEAPWRRPFEPVVVTRLARGERLRIPVVLSRSAADQVIEWRFEKETGETRDGTSRFGELAPLDERSLDGRVHERRTLELAFPVRPGYHRLRLFIADSAGTGADFGEIETSVIVVPRRCYSGPGNGARAWGIGTQLYGLRSARNWGIGDFTDLERFTGIAARLGADAVGLNPMHAMFPGNPDRISPYSPSDRRFLSFMYIDVEAIAEFGACERAQGLLRDPEFHGRLEAARSEPLVDYPGVAALKWQVLESLYIAFRDLHLGGPSGTAASERGGTFRRFQVAGGRALDRFAAFQALSEHFGTAMPWRAWPAVYQDPESLAVSAFAEEHRDRLQFFQYLQWQADQQLRTAAEAARAGGMSIGLYHDMALSADADGAEAWMNDRLLARDVRLGAPPDEWNQRGQDWGLPAYNPPALRAAAYAPFIDTLRANMAHGGALRIDHVMGLERMYWIPSGNAPQDGGYVRYPKDDLLGILALESTRQKCTVVGEDLGTLPEGFRESLNAAGILSYRLLYFAQDERGEFLAPRRYPPRALVAVGTHDLPTLPGFWLARDLDLRSEIGLFPSREMAASARERRARERRALIRAFKREGLLPESFPDDSVEFVADLVQAAYRYIARSPARIMLMHLEDVLGEEHQINLPGTVAEHPNWRRKMLVDLEILEHDPRVLALAGAIDGERRNGSRKRRKLASEPG